MQSNLSPVCPGISSCITLSPHSLWCLGIFELDLMAQCHLIFYVEMSLLEMGYVNFVYNLWASKFQMLSCYDSTNSSHNLSLHAYSMPSPMLSPSQLACSSPDPQKLFSHWPVLIWSYLFLYLKLSPYFKSNIYNFEVLEKQCTSLTLPVLHRGTCN